MRSRISASLLVPFVASAYTAFECKGQPHDLTAPGMPQQRDPAA